MPRVKANYEDLKKDERFKKELKILSNLFLEVSIDKKTLCTRLIENAAFMAVLLQDLQDDIKTNGFFDEYQNGANQFGRKRSVAADLYQVTIKNYSSAIKQLIDLLPGDKPEEDELMKFIMDK